MEIAFNEAAYAAMQAAENAYLCANGWVYDATTELWKEPPGRRDRELVQGHAVNSQKKRDRDWTRVPLPGVVYHLAPLPKDPDEPEESKWRNPCPPSVVLFATDGRGAVCVIDHQGPDAAYIFSDSITERLFFRDELVDWKFPGLWVWEGRVAGSRDYWGEYDEWTEGEVRPLTEDEARAIREDDAIWDGNLWLENWKP